MSTTLAQKVLVAFQTATKTISITTLARRERAVITRNRGLVHYKFPDGSKLQTTGRGKNHKIEVLPHESA